MWVIEKHDATAGERNEMPAVGLLEYRLIEHQLSWAMGNNALCEGDHIVEALCSAGEIVCGGDDRPATRRFSVKDVHDLLLRRGVNARDRFVEQIDLWIRSDRTRQENPAALTARKLADLSLREIGHIDTSQRIHHGSAISNTRSTKWPERWRAPHHHDLANRDWEAPVNLFGLRHICNTLRTNADRFPKYLHAAAPRLHQACNALQQS
jgi:hypothetical protein